MERYKKEPNETLKNKNTTSEIIKDNRIGFTGDWIFQKKRSVNLKTWK